MTQREITLTYRSARAALLTFSMLFGLATVSVAAHAADARRDDHRGGDHRDVRRPDDHRGGYAGGYYAPPPVAVYGNPYYAPPPVVYSPGVTLAAPGISVNIP